MSEGFIPPHGGYHNLLSYRKAEIVYDATVFFCERYIDRFSRTRDQMVQAAAGRLSTATIRPPPSDAKRPPRSSYKCRGAQSGRHVRESKDPATLPRRSGDISVKKSLKRSWPSSTC